MQRVELLINKCLVASTIFIVVYFAQFELISCDYIYRKYAFVDDDDLVNVKNVSVSTSATHTRNSETSWSRENSRERMDATKSVSKDNTNSNNVDTGIKGDHNDTSNEPKSFEDWFLDNLSSLEESENNATSSTDINNDQAKDNSLRQEKVSILDDNKIITSNDTDAQTAPSIKTTGHEKDTNHTAIALKKCTYKGSQHDHGYFKDGPCINCYCNSTSGTIKCAYKTCPDIRGCIHYETVTGHCCPVCLQYGCMYNGTSYNMGSSIDAGPCKKCYCPWGTKDNPHGTGEPKCISKTCPTPRCVDSVIPEGKCCPECANGPNCYLDGQIIAEGKRIYIDKCQFCYCSSAEYVAENMKRKATCVRSFFCL